MKAVRFSQFGGPEVLEIVDLRDLHPGPGQVRIVVRAAGVNPSDWKKREGLMDRQPGSGVAGPPLRDRPQLPQGAEAIRPRAAAGGAGARARLSSGSKPFRHAPRYANASTPSEGFFANT